MFELRWLVTQFGEYVLQYRTVYNGSLTSWKDIPIDNPYLVPINGPPKIK